MAKIRLTCAVEAEGGKDDREADCFCFLARLQFRGARLAVGAAKARISYRLDQRRGLWGQTHEGRRRGLRAEMLACNFDSAKKTIHVEEITPAPQLGSPKCASDPDTSPYRTTGNRTQKHNLIVSCATSP